MRSSPPYNAPHTMAFSSLEFPGYCSTQPSCPITRATENAWTVFNCEPVHCLTAGPINNQTFYSAEHESLRHAQHARSPNHQPKDAPPVQIDASLSPPAGPLDPTATPIQFKTQRGWCAKQASSCGLRSEPSACCTSTQTGQLNPRQLAAPLAGTPPAAVGTVASRSLRTRDVRSSLCTSLDAPTPASPTGAPPAAARCGRRTGR